MTDKTASKKNSAKAANYQMLGSYLKALSLISLSLFTLLGLFGVGYGSFMANTLRWLVGWGAYLVAILIGMHGLYLWRGYSWRDKMSWGRWLATELLIFCVLGFSTLKTNPTLLSNADMLGNSGGIIGWTIASLLSPIGRIGGMVLLSLCIFLLLPALFKMQLNRLQNMLEKQQQKVNDWRTTLQTKASARAVFARKGTSSTRSKIEVSKNQPTSLAGDATQHVPALPESRVSASRPINGTSSTSPVSRTDASAYAATTSVLRTVASRKSPTSRRRTAPAASASAASASASSISTTSRQARTPAVTSNDCSPKRPTSKGQTPFAASVTAASANVPTNRIKMSASALKTRGSISAPTTRTQRAPSFDLSRISNRSTDSKNSQALPNAPRRRASKPVAQPKTEAMRPISSRSKKRSNQSPQTEAETVEVDPAPARKAKAKINSTKKIKRDGLPPFDMLQQHNGHVDPIEGQEKARLIEDTLEHFGVPATVVEINQGPRITQFGVEPGFIETSQRDGTLKRRKVKVNAIKALGDDLALALAARSIRIQTRVPGRTYVGIELPNDHPEIVTLHSVLTSDAYQKIKGDLVIALGCDVTGQSVAADISRMPHMLIGGATGSGKSVCINTIIASLLFNLGPDKLKLLLIDPKMVELVPYNGIPHLIAPVVINMEKVVGSLSWAVREMERRYSLLSQARKRNLQSYNQWAEANGHDILPYVVIIIDELADLMMVAADKVEQIICRLAQMARATGIHLILATQRPSVDVVTGLIKANIPTRISFAVASSTDSRVILDSSGAESLLGVGDMLYQASDASRLQRIQGCYVSDQELQDLVDYWLNAKQQKSNDQSSRDKRSKQLRQKEQPTDELLPKAIALLQQHQSISVTLLQRKLRISYTRAARLINELKQQGMIGPPSVSDQ